MEMMTHYMELLASNQPWNLLIFMAIPVICAETLAITELILLFTRRYDGLTRSINKYTGIFAGFYFLGIFLYLFFTAVVPLTTAGEWRGVIDVIAVGFYLLGVVPLLGISLLEIGVIGRKLDQNEKLKLHVIFVAIFLVVAHVAMVFGMMSPDLTNMQHMTNTH